MQNAIINVNGEIVTPEFAKISVFDRAYLYGDSIYEVIRTYQGRFFLLKEHLERLKKSADLCQIDLNPNLEFYKNEIYRTFEAFQKSSISQSSSPKPLKEAYARLIISRGVGKIGFSSSSLITPSQYVIIIQPVVTPAQSVYDKGVRIQISHRVRNDQRAIDPAMKSGNYLNSVLAFLDAEKENYDDSLLCNSDGHITEGTTFNLFYIRHGIVATPPLDIGILDGITRRFVLSLLKSLKIPLREVRFPAQRIYEADEVFLTSSIKEVLAITQVDQIKIGKGLPGPITQKLHQAYKNGTLETTLESQGNQS